MYKIRRLISGGQSGVDQAALQWAIAARVPHGGWCPRGRLAENGPIPFRFQLVETPSWDVAERTAWNVRDSDATLIISTDETLTGGTDLTRTLAVGSGKPVLHLHTGMELGAAVRRLREFVAAHAINTLNVAGPRDSEEAGLAPFVQAVLAGALGEDI
jgi:hypothetical protein